MSISSSTPIISLADLQAGASQAETVQLQRTANAIRSLNQTNMFGENRELTFTLDDATHRMVINVIDRDTRETIMQLPPAYVLRLWASLQKKGP